MMAEEQQPTDLPVEAYGVFCGGIDQINASKLVANLTNATAAKITHVHVLFQSAGGFIGDGVFLHNLLRTLPITPSFYNAGQVSSAAVTAYLGATFRKVSSGGTFMIHRGTQSPQPATSQNLRHTGNNLAMDDDRTEAILRSALSLPDDLWTAMQYHELYLSAKEAVEYGLAEEIADFAPPLGTQVYNLLA